MGASGGQGMDKKSRPARVQIWYELQTKSGAIEKKNLPFVMFTMADLRGKPATPRDKMRDRKPSEITAENFDKVMKSYSPTVSFNVPNMLPGGNKEEGIPVNLTFESMKSFSPDEIAKNVPVLKKLLDARNQLQNLLSYMDADRDIESLVARLRSDENLLKSLMAEGKPADGAQ